MRIGPYEVVAEIGRGGMGVVHRARASDGRDVAVKVLLSGGAEALARFERERRLLDALGEAQGFVPLLDAGRAPRPYLVMPFVPGGTLRERLARGPLAIDEVARIGRALAAAMAEAHVRGVVHRDLKPENVLFTEGGAPLVADLGLAKHFDPDARGSQSVSLSVQGAFRGTAAYMAPEQMADAKAAGPPSDVFALGAILHECLSGEPTFQGASVLEVLGRIHEGRFTPVRRLRPETPPWLAAAIERALERDPAKRFADGAALRAALSAGEPRGARAKPLLAAVAALAVAGTLGGAALARARTAPPMGPPAPPPTATPPPLRGPQQATPRNFPALAAGFLRGQRTRLDRFAGSYAWTHADRMRSVAFLPDRQRVATASHDRTVTVWSYPDGEPLRTFGPFPLPLYGMAVSPDGHLLVGDEQGVLRGFHLRTGADSGLERLGHGTIDMVAVRADGLVAATGRDGTVTLLDPSTLGVYRTIQAHEGPAWDAAFLGDDRLVTVGADKKTRCWNTDSGAPSWTVDEGQENFSVALSSDGTRMLLAGEPRASWWELAQPPRLLNETAISGRGFSCAISTDGTRAIVGSEGPVSLAVWDPTSAAAPAKLEAGGFARALALGPDDARFLVAGVQHRLGFWNLAALPAQPVKAAIDMPRVALSMGGELVVADSVKLEVRDPATLDVLRSFETPSDATRALDLTLERGGTALVSGPAAPLRRVDLATGRAVAVLASSTAWAHVLGTPGGRWILAGGAAGPVEQLDGRDGARVRTLDMGVTGSWSGAGAMLDEQRALIGSAEGGLTLVDLESGAMARRPQAHAAPILALAASPEDGIALTVAEDHSVAVWEISGSLETWRRVPLAASLDGRATTVSLRAGRAVIGTQAGALHVLDIGGGREIDRLDLASALDAVYSVALEADARAFHVGTARGVLLRFVIEAGR